MRQLLTLIFSTIILTAFGQDKSLLGTYKNTDIHTLILTLQADNKFETEETGSDGRRIIFGTWTIENNLITLQTSKIWYWDNKNPNEKKEFIPKNFRHTIISVDKEKQLKILPAKNPRGEDEMLEFKLKKIK